VKIDIDNQLYEWRQELSQKDASRHLHAIFGKVLTNPALFDTLGNLMAKAQKTFPSLVNLVLSKYTKGRKLPDVPDQDFKKWFKNNHG
jgi:L-lactate dehydrogenase complex protein LldF